MVCGEGTAGVKPMLFSPFGTFKLDLDGGWARLWVKDTRVLRVAIRVSRIYWGLKILGEKASQKC